MSKVDPIQDPEEKTRRNKIAFNILINEVVPRANKCKKTVADFLPANVCGALVSMEMMGEYTRRDTRNYLDKILEVHKSNEKVAL